MLSSVVRCKVLHRSNNVHVYKKPLLLRRSLYSCYYKQKITPTLLRFPRDYSKNNVHQKTLYKQPVIWHMKVISQRDYSQNNDLSTENWNTLYKYSGIKYIRVISRFKVYQIMFMTSLCYPLYTWYLDGLISKMTFLSGIGGCIGTSLVFIIFSYFSTKVIGELAVSENEVLIRLSRLTFYGKRVEDYFATDQVIPWLDESTDAALRNYFQRMYVYNDRGDKLNYVYTLRHGKIYDKELLFHIIGIPYSDQNKHT